jgi:hypothetical protein
MEQAVGGRGTEQVVPSGMMEALKPCWAVATSGIPVREQLFNGSICRHSPFSMFPQGEFASRAFGHSLDASAPLEVATPVFLPVPDAHHHRKRSHGDVVFLNSRGEVSIFCSNQSGSLSNSIYVADVLTTDQPCHMEVL